MDFGWIKDDTHLTSFWREEYRLTLVTFSLALGLFALNLILANLIRTQNLYYVANSTPIGFGLNLITSLALILGILGSIVYSRLHLKYPIASILIIAGSLSNFTEKTFIYNSVTDYINFNLAIFNLADIQIWLGLIWLNIAFWINHRPEQKPHHT